MTLAQELAAIALGVTTELGGEGPFFSAVVRSDGGPMYDDGGSIATPGAVVGRSCVAQIDSVTEAMRNAEGFTDRDMRILILGLNGPLDTSHVIEMIDGPNVGAWTLQSAVTDPAGIGWECRGRIEATEPVEDDG